MASPAIFLPSRDSPKTTPNAAGASVHELNYTIATVDLFPRPILGVQLCSCYLMMGMRGAISTFVFFFRGKRLPLSIHTDTHI